MELPCVHGSSITTFAWLGGRACIWARGRRLGFWERREGDSSETHGGQALSHGGAAVHTSRVGADRKHEAGRARAPPQREGQGAAHQALSPQLPHGAKCCGHMTRGPSTHCPPPMSTKQLLGASRAEEGPTKLPHPPGAGRRACRHRRACALACGWPRLRPGPSTQASPWVSALGSVHRTQGLSDPGRGSHLHQQAAGLPTARAREALRAHPPLTLFTNALSRGRKRRRKIQVQSKGATLTLCRKQPHPTVRRRLPSLSVGVWGLRAGLSHPGRGSGSRRAESGPRPALPAQRKGCRRSPHLTVAAAGARRAGVRPCQGHSSLFL